MGNLTAELKRPLELLGTSNDAASATGHGIKAQTYENIWKFVSKTTTKKVEQKLSKALSRTTHLSARPRGL